MAEFETKVRIGEFCCRIRKNAASDYSDAALSADKSVLSALEHGQFAIFRYDIEGTTANLVLKVIARADLSLLLTVVSHYMAVSLDGRVLLCVFMQLPHVALGFSVVLTFYIPAKTEHLSCCSVNRLHQSPSTVAARLGNTKKMEEHLDETQK